MAHSMLSKLAKSITVVGVLSAVVAISTIILKRSQSESKDESDNKPDPKTKLRSYSGSASQKYWVELTRTDIREYKVSRLPTLSTESAVDSTAPLGGSATIPFGGSTTPALGGSATPAL